MRIRTFVASICAVSVGVAAHANIVVYNFGLDGLQEVPPNASPGSGFATVTLNTVTGEVDVDGTFSGLVSPATAAHIHGLAAPGVNAGIILGLVVTPATSGTFTGNGILSSTNVQGMLDGLTYINVHSGQFPGGEIRGQIVPTPGAGALLALAALGAARRRR